MRGQDLNLRPCGYEPHELTRLLHPAILGFIMTWSFLPHFITKGYELLMRTGADQTAFARGNVIYGITLPVLSQAMTRAIQTKNSSTAESSFAFEYAAHFALLAHQLLCFLAVKSSFLLAMLTPIFHAQQAQ